MAQRKIAATAVDTETVLQNISKRLAGQLATLKTAQDTYHAGNGRYAQGLWTNKAPPADGIEATPDNLNSKPTDQRESWDDLARAYGLTFPSKTMASISVDAYDGERGTGWVVNVRASVNGAIYECAVNFGAEEWRTHDWREVIEWRI